MSTHQTLYEEPIAALATPPGESALAVIRTSGTGIIELLARGFSRPEALLESPGHSLVYGWLEDEKGKVDEVTLAVFRAPRSYTGEESVEILSHGSLPGIQRIMALLFDLGFRQAEPGEFSLRSFLNGKMDLSSAEAVHELVKSRSRKAQSMAINRLAGGVYKEIDRVKSRLVDIMASVTVQLDYPDDELPGEEDDSAYLAGLVDPAFLEDARIGLERLSSSYRAGRLYQEGVRVALAGRTNAGKSSLFNLFLREDRSIVSDIHGTTRDYIEAPLDLDGIPVRLFDTAGLRDVDEIIEAEGIRRSGQIIENSSIILYLVDGSSEGGINEFDRRQLARIAELGISSIPLWTKIDTPKKIDPPEGFIGISAVSAQGFETLQEAMSSLLTADIPRFGEADVVIDSLRQKQLIDEAGESLKTAAESINGGQPLDMVALDLQNALRCLGEITGEVSSEDILDRVFSGFCVGK